MAKVAQADHEVLGVGYDIINDIIFETGFCATPLETECFLTYNKRFAVGN